MISAHPLLKINIREQLPRPLIRSPHLSPRTTPPHRENHAAPADATDFFNSLLDRSRIVKGFGTSNPKRRHGVVALTPGFNWTKDWDSYGAIVADKETVADALEALKSGD